MSSIVTLALLPLLGAVLVGVLPSSNELRIKQAALATTILTAVFGIFIATQFVKGDTGFQFAQKLKWIPSFAINFSVGVDGLALVDVARDAGREKFLQRVEVPQHVGVDVGGYAQQRAEDAPAAALHAGEAGRVVEEDRAVEKSRGGARES